MNKSKCCNILKHRYISTKEGLSLCCECGFHCACHDKFGISENSQGRGGECICGHLTSDHDPAKHAWCTKCSCQHCIIDKPTPQPESEGVEMLENWSSHFVCSQCDTSSEFGQSCEDCVRHKKFVTQLLQAQYKQIRREERERVCNLIENAEGQQHDFKSLSSCSRCGKYCHWSEGCDCCVQIDIPALKAKIINSQNNA